ncbi:hypothetical protein O1611_g5567 [Lasiodiplodia mahajangana]|uniref:Uncharacterized protein n=1 Tax=Lasiodiplodia mahajangana TaxID=1108764 RepID=A0ACC2JKT8_9PEZI|nr:hypothetical protein O1611_g5567 [Lasiodiplodia mahajangana]
MAIPSTYLGFGLCMCHTPYVAAQSDGLTFPAREGLWTQGGLIRRPPSSCAMIITLDIWEAARWPLRISDEVGVAIESTGCRQACYDSQWFHEGDQPLLGRWCGLASTLLSRQYTPRMGQEDITA